MVVSPLSEGERVEEEQKRKPFIVFGSVSLIRFLGLKGKSVPK